jgi:hypothetical protein
MTNTALQPGISFGPGSSGGGAIGQATPAPIHDIVGPLPFFSGPLWVIITVFLVAGVGAALFWWWSDRVKAKVITPREAALEALGRLRERITEGSDHDFGVGVSDVLRRFLGEALGLSAPRQTTEEFLESLRGSLRFIPAEQEALAEFLHRADYMKFACGEATPEQRLALIDAAESFVQSGEKPAVNQAAGDVASPGTVSPAGNSDLPAIPGKEEKK